MPQVKIRHGAATWQVKVKDGGNLREQTETGFRGMVVDMPQSEIDRLKPLGAVVDVGAELPLGGRLTPVPSTASDAELVAWASVANRSEIIEEIGRQPALGDRLLAAYEVVQQQLASQNELLGGLKPDIEKAQEEADRVEAEAAAAREAEARRQAEADAEALAASEAASAATLAATGGDGDELEDPDRVVQGNVQAVSKYLSEHPDQAEEILAAENRRAASATADSEKQPRVGVLNAVEAAAGHTQ